MANRGRPKLALIDQLAGKIAIEGMDITQVKAMLTGPREEWSTDHWLWTGACCYAPDRPRFQKHGTQQLPKTASPVIGRNGTSMPARRVLGEMLLGTTAMVGRRVSVNCTEPRCMNPDHWDSKGKVGSEAGGLEAVCAEIRKLDPQPENKSDLLSRVTCFSADEVLLAAKHMGFGFV